MSDPTVPTNCRRFYEEFPFPGSRPIDRDGLILLRHFAESVSRATSPDRVRVLDAGCGTGNTSLSLARRFTAIDFLGVDQSEASLARARASASGVPNLGYRQWNLAKPLPRTERFDIILCLGVLHHTANMRQVLRNLRRALRENGELYLWIYGRHGRYRHSLNVRLLSMLLKAKPAPRDRVAFARDFIQNAGHGSVSADLPGTEGTLALQKSADEVWIADQLLNPHEELLDMKDLLTLVSSSGLSLERLLGFDQDPHRNFPSAALRERFELLTRDQRLIALDLLLKPERYFAILHKSRVRI
jgi:SAM-dependent methyltransferase